MNVRAYTDRDLTEMIRIWNEVVEDGIAFPQEEKLVTDCLKKGKELGFRVLQFNAVSG